MNKLIILLFALFLITSISALEMLNRIELNSTDCKVNELCIITLTGFNRENYTTQLDKIFNQPETNESWYKLDNSYNKIFLFNETGEVNITIIAIKRDKSIVENILIDVQKSNKVPTSLQKLDNYLSENKEKVIYGILILIALFILSIAVRLLKN